MADIKMAAQDDESQVRRLIPKGEDERQTRSIDDSEQSSENT